MTPDAGVRLRTLAVRDFRNLARVDAELPAPGVAIVGENGHGKTNVLEAIYYLQLLRSVRGARDVDLVRFGEAGFHLAATAEVGAVRRITVGFARSGRRKRVMLDGGEVQRLSDGLGALPAVIVSPRDVQLVAGAPSERRRYLDIVLALTSRPYLVALQQYRAALERRNAALRELARGGHGPERAAVWEPALAEYGAVLWAARTAWVARVAEEFARLCREIGERSTARLRYVTSLDPGATGDPRSALLAALEAQRGHDARRGLTHAGPHRDDLELALAERPLRLFGSAGQQRTAAIALRLLDGATLREHVGHAPLLLLDDPFAELDAQRAHRILRLLGAAGVGQVVLAVPRPGDIPAAMTALDRWTIRDGRLSAG